MAAMTHHVVDPDRFHHVWDLDLEPTLTIASGDTVEFELRARATARSLPGGSYEDAQLDFDTMYNLSGPIHVEGAEPGDVLQVDVLALKAGNWGWTAILPGMGLLADDFADGYVRTYDLSGGKRIDFAPDIKIPISPFLGVLGNHPGTPGRQLPFPPHGGGGNIDNRHLTVGTSVFLPVFVDGARFSCGDPHAAQGDGEVCVSAVECPMDATLRMTVLKDADLGPSFVVPAGSVSQKDEQGYFATMGIDADLMTGAQIAVRAMVRRLSHEYDLSPQDAYVLCSIAGDLRIHEIVDAGVWNVGFTMPFSIFAD